MNANQLKGLGPVLRKIADERDHLFSRTELNELSATLAAKYFESEETLLIPCERVCGSPRCSGALVAKQRALCPVDKISAKLADPEVYRQFRFRMESFLGDLQAFLGLTPAPVGTIARFRDLGVTGSQGLTWRFVFAGHRLVEWAALLNAGLRAACTEDAVVIITDTQIEGRLALELLALNIFIVTSDELAEKSTDKVLKDIAAENQHVFHTWSALKAYVHGTFNPYHLSRLMNLASTAQSADFEDEAFRAIAPFFDTAIQLGKEYTGRSLPDGLLFTRVEGRYHVVLYDCKSFKGSEFKPKAEDVQQQYYYADLIASLGNVGMSVSGCMVLTNKVTPQVTDHIRSLQPWALLATKHGLLLIGADQLEHMTRVWTGLQPQVFTSFSREVFFSLLVMGIVSPQKDDLDSDLLAAFEKLANRSKFHELHGVTSVEVELALSLGYLRGHRSDVHTSVFPIINNAGSNRVVGTRWSPIERDIIRGIESKAYETLPETMGLSPLTLLVLGKLNALTIPEMKRGFQDNQDEFAALMRSRLPT